MYIEEAGNFPSPAPILKLMATLRSGAGVPCRHSAHRQPRRKRPSVVACALYRSGAIGLKVLRDPDRVGTDLYSVARGRQRLLWGRIACGVPSASGSPELVRAWLHGDSNCCVRRVLSGVQRRPSHHPPARPCRSTLCGSARLTGVRPARSPCIERAVGDGSLPDIARGCLVCYREWYGMKPGEPNVGLRMTAEQVAEGIRDRERDDPKPKDGNVIGVADPSIFAEDGGPSIASRMTRAARIIFRPGDNKRVPQRGAMGGWDQVRARLVGDADGKPMVVLFATCRDLIRTLPALQHDASRAEDIDTEMEDHAADSCFVAGTMIETARGAVPIERRDTDGSGDDPERLPAGDRSVQCRERGQSTACGCPNGATLTGTADHPVLY